MKMMGWTAPALPASRCHNVVVADGPSTRAIEHQVIQLAAVIVVEGKSLAVRAFQLVDAGSLRRSVLRAHRCESASGVRENLHRPCAGAIEHQMIQLAAVIVIEGKYLIGRGVAGTGRGRTG